MRSWRPLRLRRDRCRVVLASSSTMRKFENFTTTQIFHEINFCKQKVPEMAIWTISEAVISSFWEILAIFIGWNFLNSKFTAYEIIKKAIFGTFRLPKLISRKIWAAIKFSNFHTVSSEKKEREVHWEKSHFQCFVTLCRAPPLTNDSHPQTYHNVGQKMVSSLCMALDPS